MGTGCPTRFVCPTPSCRLHGLKTGPAAADHLQALTSYDLHDLRFGWCAPALLKGINVYVAQDRYMGEDGFEVSPLPIVSALPAADTQPRFLSLLQVPRYLHPRSSARQCNLLVSVHMNPYTRKWECVCTAATSTRTQHL